MPSPIHSSTRRNSWLNSTAMALVVLSAVLLFSIPSFAADAAAPAPPAPPAAGGATPAPQALEQPGTVPPGSVSPGALADFSDAPACPPEVMALLQDADFLTVRNLKAALPHGNLVINQGVIASFKGWDKHTAGVVVGDIDVNLTNLPTGPGTYEAFPDMLDGKNQVHLKAQLSYLIASVDSAAQMVHGNETIAAMRRWSALTPHEQAQFESVYRASWANGWLDDAASKTAGHPVIREPVKGECFGAVWIANWRDAPAGALTRIDFRVEADGKTAVAREFASGKLLMQTPYSPTAADKGSTPGPAPQHQGSN